MPTQLQTLILQARSRLDEVLTYPSNQPPGLLRSFGRFYTDGELTDWLNEGATDVARRAETIQNFATQIWTTAGTAKYAMPQTVIRIHRVEFVPNGTNNQYPVQASTYQEMDQYWGITQTTQRSYPYFYVLWGMPPNLTMQLYPVPSQAGNLNIFYYRLPIVMAQPTDIAEVPEGWSDLLIEYCDFKGKMKNRDPLAQQAKKEYEDKLQNMIDVTRQWHDQTRTIFVGTSAIPEWLYGGQEF